VAIKTLINNQMCEKYGSHWYMDSDNFRTLQAVNDTPLDDTEAYAKFSHETFIRDLTESCRVGSQHNFISNYMSVYNDPPLPPSWMIFEIITFGTVSKIYEYLNDVAVRDNVAGVFNLTKKMLTSWLHCVTNIRNICAHHSKLVYTTLIIQPIFPTRPKKKFLSESDLVITGKVYSILCCIQHLLKNINPNSIYKKNLLDLIDKNPQIDYRALGFTPNWRAEPLWSILQ
jgi:abortive infection bacteriophage resistance protein